MRRRHTKKTKQYKQKVIVANKKHPASYILSHERCLNYCMIEQIGNQRREFFQSLKSHYISADVESTSQCFTLILVIAFWKSGTA